jgi:hypothetical protein
VFDSRGMGFFWAEARSSGWVPQKRDRLFTIHDPFILLTDQQAFGVITEFNTVWVHGGKRLVLFTYASTNKYTRNGQPAARFHAPTPMLSPKPSNTTTR